MVYDVAIVGGGPAGITAALYAYRAGKKVIIFEKNLFGGNINNAPNIENYPGFNSISGMDLAEKMFNQIADNVEPVYEEVIKLGYKNKIHKLITLTNTYDASSVILATGTEHRKLMLPNEDDYSGISYCALCDGSFYQDNDVIIIGGGNTAFQEAIYLSNICKTVNLVYRGSNFRADNSLVDKVNIISNIKCYTNLTPVKYIAEDNIVTGMSFIDSNQNEVIINSSGIFIAIGQDPNIMLLDRIEFKKGIMVTPLLTPTGHHSKGIFVAGDCIYKPVKQISTAISDGAIAATNAIDYLNKV